MFHMFALATHEILNGRQTPQKLASLMVKGLLREVDMREHCKLYVNWSLCRHNLTVKKSVLLDDSVPPLPVKPGPLSLGVGWQ